MIYTLGGVALDATDSLAPLVASVGRDWLGPFVAPSTWPGPWPGRAVHSPVYVAPDGIAALEAYAYRNRGRLDTGLPGLFGPGSIVHLSGGDIPGGSGKVLLWLVKPQGYVDPAGTLLRVDVGMTSLDDSVTADDSLAFQLDTFQLDAFQ